MVCDSLQKKYPPLGDGDGPVELWRQRERTAVPQEEDELRAATAAAAAAVQGLWGTVFDTAIEVLLGGNAQFTKLHELPTLEATSAVGGHDEL